MRKKTYSICHYDTSRELLRHYCYQYVFFGPLAQKYVSEPFPEPNDTLILVKNLTKADKVLLRLQGHLKVADLDESYIHTTVIASL